MKWYKHETNSIKDDKIQYVIEKHGANGYMLYHGFLELVGEKLKPGNLDPTATFRWTFLRSIFHLSRKTIQLFLTDCSEHIEFSFSFSKEELRISCPNLLKRLDDHTRKSGATYQKVPLEERRKKKEERIQELNGVSSEKQVSRETNFDQLKTFEEFFKNYPHQVKRSRAIAMWFETVVSRDIASRIQKSLKNYKQYLEIEAWQKPQEAHNWLAEWGDWEDWKKKPAFVKKEPKPNPDCTSCDEDGKLPDGVKCWCWV